MTILQNSWFEGTVSLDSAKSISTKFKNLREVLKTWKSGLPNLAAAISKSKELVQFLDVLEEARDLTLEEWNFRNIINEHLRKLLHQQRTYWKQRGTINWVKFGYECTAFFHANASIRHRKNFISSLVNSVGVELLLHEEKAELLWRAYKDRMGVTEFTHMYFDLPSLLRADNNLGVLRVPSQRRILIKSLLLFQITNPLALLASMGNL
jgi:hypothetical protein